ncbi:esterase-like activity of phytase family protein [Phyllobacterium sp. 0TCS1.6A]|uniref:esterase-like activity of phytase family protein n=1 Tax=Phyllobacterium sp. 0TCS1.6A TaxID=2995637 RepID=UPI002263FE02|nr:esterase-like activity of phytase family protein [Phyllobacterium sp. 0TCS1.6A]MCX8293053.1 esterase-like activity of phytase family protein [Phyllobacterium sp. 0TCS1.6A]
MSHKTVSLALLAALATSVALPAAADPVFNRIASFPVIDNLPESADRSKPTSAEIITASEDGMTLVYSDSPNEAIGFVDITDAAHPKPGGQHKVDGEPTSVAIVGGNIFAAINTSKDKANPSGKLEIIDLASKKSVLSCDLGGQPDSVAISPDKSFAAIAIENERDEEQNEGALPQLPSGNLKIFALKDGLPDCAAAKTVDLTGIAEIAPEDAEPEFVSINAGNQIAVTLQENNHIAIVDAASGKIASHFSAGAVDLDGIDTGKDGALRFDGSIKGALREPDAVKWLDEERLVTANEGDYKGGSRSFTIFTKDGKVAYESGASLEHRIAAAGHYPDKRNKKGVELEGAEVGRFGETNYLFVASERASIVGVYKDTKAEPEFVQLLPSGVGPEGILAIPSRNLLVTANETDLVEDGGARAHVMVYELKEQAPNYPQIVSEATGDVPLGWGALSGLSADAEKPGRLHAVADSFYSAAPTIFTIEADRSPARITQALPVTRGGAAAQKLDLEGITTDGDGGYWLANEGDAAKLVPHAILNVNAKGEIKQEIALPAELLAHQTRFGLEGITRVGEGDDAVLWMAIQREWSDDEKGFTKLLRYDIKDKSWSAVAYPLDKTDAGWVGLSEITAHDGQLYLIERDNQIGGKAANKRLYRVALEELKPVKLGEKLPVAKKALAHDFLGDLKGTNGYVAEKLEGFAIDADGNGFAVTDNDGVDDSSGETLFFNIGKVAATH